MGSPTHYKPDGGRPRFVTNAFFATTASAIVTRNSTSLGAFTGASAFPAPTVAITGSGFTVPATDFDLPKIQITSAPPGIYKITATFSFITSTGSNPFFAIGDDSAASSGKVEQDSAGTNFQQGTVVGCFRYTSAGTRTFELFAGVNTGTVSVRNDSANTQTTFTVEYYPL